MSVFKILNRHLAVISLALMVIFGAWGAHLWGRSQANRINDNQRRIEEVSRVCETFAREHNGLVREDVKTLEATLAAHSTPQAQAIIQARIDQYYSHIVDPRDCLPK